jgi:hypothetical protein
MVALNHEKLLEQIDTFSIELKTKIVDKILTSLTPLNNEIDSFWIIEANKRKNEIKSGKVELKDGDTVFKDILQQLK